MIGNTIILFQLEIELAMHGVLQDCVYKLKLAKHFPILLQSQLWNEGNILGKEAVLFEKSSWDSGRNFSWRSSESLLR